MKKLLALVLALVMTMGLATVGTNAAYSDADEISFNEAVDVMTAVGVFQGNNGKFMPKANLDRASAAKLIAYLDLGAKTAEALPAVSNFADVPASHWAAKYIAYCNDAGYIVGDGTNFYPATALSGYAFGKMLLCVLGYDAKTEGYEGANWTIAVAKRMTALGIPDGVEGNPSKTLTREEAAQYCFNALFALKVAYASNGTTIKTGDVEIITGSSKADPDEYSVPNKTLADALYGVDALEEVKDGEDAFGRPAKQWKLNDEVIGEYPAKATKTYTTTVTGGKLYTDLGKVKGLNVTVIEDGVEQSDAPAIVSGGTDRIGGNGVLTEVFKNGKDVTITVIHTYVGKITEFTAAKTDKDGDVTDPAHIQVKEIGASFTGTFNTDAYKKADKGTVVLFTAANGAIQSVETAKVEEDVTARKFSANKLNNYTVAYDNYLEETDGIELGSSQNLYFDSYGYLVYNELYKAAESNTYVYVLRVGTTSMDEWGVEGDTVPVLYIDATGKTTKVTGDAETEPDVGKWYTTTEKDGVVSFKEAEAVYGSANEVNAKTPTLTAGLKANNNTTFVVKTGSNTWKVYDGLKNLPTAKKTGMLVTGILNAAGFAKLVYIDATGASGAETKDATPVFALEQESVELADDDKTVIEVYTAIVGTELTTISVVEGTDVIYDIATVTKNAKGFVTKFTAFDTSAYDVYNVESASYDAGVLAINDGEAEAVADNVPMYVYDFESGEFTTQTIADIDGADEGILYVMLKSGAPTAYYWLQNVGI